MVEMEVQGSRKAGLMIPNWRSEFDIWGYLDTGCRWAVVSQPDSNPKTTLVAVVDTSLDRLAVECPLTQTSVQRQVCWHPDYTITYRNYRGRGLAYQLYLFLMRHGVILRSGRSQSRSSQRMWGRLCGHPAIEVWCVKSDQSAIRCDRCDFTGRPDTPEYDPYDKIDTVCLAIHSGAFV